MSLQSGDGLGDGLPSSKWERAGRVWVGVGVARYPVMLSRLSFALLTLDGTDWVQ